MYSQITANKRKTWFLIFLFTLIILALGWTFGAWMGNETSGIVLAAIIATLMTLIGYYRGDKVALAVSGAKEVHKQDAPELYRLIENLCIADGLPTPKVYLIDDPSPNAFATGRDPEHASVAVTTGLLHIMEKAELEGVLAHELSHVKNYDVRVMTLVVVLVGVVLLFSDWMTRAVFYGGNRKNSDRESSAGVLFLIGLVLALLSPLFAQLIKLAVSRSREYLADASGVLLTRYPDGLARALEKIAKMDQPLKRPNHATAHLYLANPFDPHVTKKFEQLFSTHPPIEERIRKLKEAGS
ncbi:zinc metalloprotease HtpX [Candidatus Uhrbacteria bacterium]|nr:zinc metalloprotease HtpX [Candidatus Uhrbacteria bacterium]